MANLNWQFPRGIGGNTSQPYMILTSYKSLNAIESAPNPMSSIALYIPPNSLKQTTDANWSGVEGGALKAGAMGAIESITGLDKLMRGGEGGVTDWGETIGNIFTSAGMGMFQAGAKQFDKGTGMLSAGTGIAVNNHMAMAYKGPDKFRTHEFAFNFFPKNKDDAKEIKEIIYDFQNGMLPRMMGKSLKANRKLSKPFFNSPRHWNIEFYNGDGTKNQVTETIEGKVVPKPGFLFEIKKSVITSMTVNHDPNSTVSLHADGSPVQTAFSLTFQEIELPISGDTLTDLQIAQEDVLLQAQEKSESAAAAQAESDATGNSGNKYNYTPDWP